MNFLWNDHKLYGQYKVGLISEAICRMLCYYQNEFVF